VTDVTPRTASVPGIDSFRPVTFRDTGPDDARVLVTLRRVMDGGSTLAWLGEDAARMEVARVERHGDALTAEGTQLGAVYEVRYRLESELLSVELVGGRTREVRLGDADFFDLGYFTAVQLAPGHARPLAGKRRSAHVHDVLGRYSVA
jgi:hypothetical protein